MLTSTRSCFELGLGFCFWFFETESYCVSRHSQTQGSGIPAVCFLMPKFIGIATPDSIFSSDVTEMGK